MTRAGGSRPPDLKLVGSRPPIHEEIPGAKVLGTLVLVGSLAMLFFASMIGYFYVRAHATQWPPPGMPALPVGLWLSTLVLLGTSGAIHRAVLAARLDATPAIVRWTRVTLALGLLFLLLQAWNWAELVAQSMTPRINLYGFTFYLLTGLHAAHVIGGLIPLAIVVRNAGRGRYTAREHAGLTQCAIYWHFLDVVWVLVFVVLLSGS